MLLLVLVLVVVLVVVVPPVVVVVVCWKDTSGAVSYGKGRWRWRLWWGAGRSFLCCFFSSARDMGGQIDVGNV